MDLETADLVAVQNCRVDAVHFVADFPWGARAGYSDARFSEDGVVSEADPGGFAGRSSGIGGNVLFAGEAEAVVEFVRHVPGGGVHHHDFVEDVEFVVYFYGADARHVVHVEVET